MISKYGDADDRVRAQASGLRPQFTLEADQGGQDKGQSEFGELEEILSGVTFRVWSDLVAAAQATPRATGATGLVSMPRALPVPSELDIHRKDLDRARGVPNRGGGDARARARRAR